MSPNVLEGIALAIKLADVQNMHIGHQEITEEPLAVARFVTNSH